MPGGAGFLPSTGCVDGIYKERLLMIQKFGEPVELGSFGHHLQGFHTYQLVRRISLINHQQYGDIPMGFSRYF